MKNYSVTLMPENIIVNVPEGTNLLMAAKAAGINIESPCGGYGTCGKCAVKIIKGTVDAEDHHHLSGELKDEGYVLACNARVNCDVTVEVPQFSRLTKHQVMLSGKNTKHCKENDYFAKRKQNPVCGRYHIKLNTPDLSDNLNDFDRIKTALTKLSGIQDLTISLEVLRKLPEVVRQGLWEVTVYTVTINGSAKIINIEAGIVDRPAYAIAVDIGTTTVAVNLIDAGTGKVVDKAGTYNKQALYGSDVISRIIYTDEKPDGLDVLQKAVIDTINELISEILGRNSLRSIDILAMVCAGNTVMTHMFMKVPATYLRLEPYIPAATDFPVVSAKDLNLNIHPDAKIVTLPSVASYVGGDITAGVLATMIADKEELTLFIDIGTNGELVLGNSDWLVTCSCSAGPAFEGSGISCGMRAMDGAIDHIKIDRSSFELEYRTIGDAKPIGICGSGLIYSLSEMMEAGLIDRAGKILDNLSSRRIRTGSEGTEYVLAFSDETGSNQDVVITESDIKNLLRAKGAIFAGIRTMLNQVQLELKDIDKVYIAGGFGNYINISDAMNIGLLPELPVDKFEYVGNSSIQGATIVLMCQEAMAEAKSIASAMTYLELSVGNLFMEEFISAVFIPHTDLSLFPSAVKN